MLLKAPGAGFLGRNPLRTSGSIVNSRYITRSFTVLRILVARTHSLLLSKKSSGRISIVFPLERAEDVLAHKKLLLQAHNPANWLAFDVRTVQMPRGASFSCHSPSQKNNYIPPPTFGSSTNLEILALGPNRECIKDEDSVSNAISSSRKPDNGGSAHPRPALVHLSHI
ncbi:hypothetical protein KSP39_PZI001011 [Platanthera zijinensis]|uniref:Uncharacterized protein n=1 Tax=Platanthera zijinensis TaxID=2320716 RepID=A0AAP0GF00_9ASPA